MLVIKELIVETMMRYYIENKRGDHLNHFNFIVTRILNIS